MFTIYAKYTGLVAFIFSVGNWLKKMIMLPFSPFVGLFLFN